MADKLPITRDHLMPSPDLLPTGPTVAPAWDHHREAAYRTWMDSLVASLSPPRRVLDGTVGTKAEAMNHAAPTEPR